MTNQTRILVIEDSRDLCIEMVDYLVFSGYCAEGVHSVAEMAGALTQDAWDVLILDLNLPDGDGVQVARELRQQRGMHLGIVMVTARGQVDDRITGITAGADAYLVKPVDLRELKAVANQLIARLPQDEPSAPREPSWQLDRVQRVLMTPNRHQIPLTGSEAMLLDALMTSPATPITRYQLVNVLPPGPPHHNTRRLDSLISRLRSKVEQSSGHALPVHTFRNQGYAFTGPVASAASSTG